MHKTTFVNNYTNRCSVQVESRTEFVKQAFVIGKFLLTNKNVDVEARKVLAKLFL